MMEKDEKGEEGRRGGLVKRTRIGGFEVQLRMIL
jgi:hypothetical protein